MSDPKFRGSNGQERVASRATGASSEIGTDALRPLAAPGNTPLTTLRVPSSVRG